MNRYRKILYDTYRTNIFEKQNPTDAAGEKSVSECYRKDFAKFLPVDKQIRILDIGCGSGYLVKYLRECGYVNVTGVDTSEEQVLFARSKGLPVICCDALEYLKNNGKFNMIFSTGVIEHLAKDEIIDFLFAVLKALEPGGVFIIRTDNASTITGITARYLDMTHEILFTESSLYQVLSACGFSEIEITDTGVPFGLRPRRLLRWILFKIWRTILTSIYLIEVGQCRPRLLGKNLIARTVKPADV